jgi:hypothetical protein
MKRARGGRPIRCFLLLTGCWIGARLWLTMGDAASEAARQAPPVASMYADCCAPRSVATTLARSAEARAPSGRIVQLAALFPLPARAAAPTPPAPPRAVTQTKDADEISVDLMDFIRVTTAYANRHYATDIEDMTTSAPASSPLVTPVPLISSGRDRWSANGWFFWRDGSAMTATSNPGRLGGSQAGLRVDFDLTPAARSRTGAFARATTALNRPAAPEAAIGVAFQPSRGLPLSLLAERRIALGAGGRNAGAFLVVGGFGPKPVGPSIEAEGYVQAGMVGLRSRDLFMDGKLSLLHGPANSRLRIGASVSGGAQPAVSRVDVGSEMRVRLPLPNANARLGLEWRARVAGNAAPRSGLALTLAADF